MSESDYFEKRRRAENQALSDPWIADLRRRERDHAQRFADVAAAITAADTTSRTPEEVAELRQRLARLEGLSQDG